MKKVLFIATIAALSGSVTAQVNFGAQVGGNMGNVKSEYTESGTTVKQDTKSKFGFLIGVVAEIPVSTSLFFRPELNFIQKGAKIDDTQTESGATIVTKGEQTLNFIELPLNLVYSVPAGSGNVFFGAGPSIGFGISGKNEYSYTVSFPGFPTQSESGESDVKFDGKKADDVPADDNDTHLKGLDFGANILAGYKMANGIYLNLGYQMGFSNLDPNPNSSLKTNGLTFKIGYMFGGKSASND